ARSGAKAPTDPSATTVWIRDRCHQPPPPAPPAARGWVPAAPTASTLWRVADSFIHRAEHEIADGESDVEVVFAHEAQVMVLLVMITQNLHQLALSDPAAWIEVIDEMEPLVRQKITHRRGHI